MALLMPLRRICVQDIGIFCTPYRTIAICCDLAPQTYDIKLQEMDGMAKLWICIFFIYAECEYTSCFQLVD